MPVPTNQPAQLQILFMACRRACKSRKTSASEVHDWCCSLDADLVLLLTGEEMDTYHQRVCPAAALHSQELQQCPQTDCIGLAVAEQGVVFSGLAAAWYSVISSCAASERSQLLDMEPSSGQVARLEETASTQMWLLVAAA